MKPEQIVAKVFGRDPIEIDDQTRNDMLAEWDSLGHITLIIELESAYGLSFGPDEVLAMTNVSSIKDVLRAQGATW